MLRGVVNILKRIEPRIGPWGTPPERGYGGDVNQVGDFRTGKDKRQEHVSEKLDYIRF